MILHVKDVNDFIKEARDAGVIRVYTALWTSVNRKNGVPFHQTRLVVTAAGRMQLHEKGEAERVVIRYERDFGPVLPDPADMLPPKDYWEKVENWTDAVVRELREAGLVIHDGEVEMPCAKT